MTTARPVLPQLSPHVAPATDVDMAFIRAWLQKQDEEKVAGTFFCNWALTERRHLSGDVVVYRDPRSREAVAYQWGGLLQPGILEVRHDMRRGGVGRVLVAHRLAQAVALNEDILVIQCEPETSIPFWQGMGFELLDDPQAPNHAMRMLPRALELPAEGQPVEVSLEWFAESRKWNPDTAPAYSQRIVAKRVGGCVFLAERGLSPNRIKGKDVFLEVLVDGQQWLLDKAKYETALAMGVQRNRNGFYVDRLKLIQQ